MSLGEKLNTYIERQERKQAEVAATWLEEWKKKGEKPRRDTTVNSQLNRLLKDNPQGVRFFFSDAARAALLFDVLRVPPDQRSELLELAERALKSEGMPPRLIVDATPWPRSGDGADALFASIKQELLTRGPFPVLLIILDEQYDRLPRSFDELKDKLRYVRVKNEEEGWERVLEFAEEQGLVISSRRFEDFERWLATEFAGNRLLFEPENGLELFRASGRLPGLEEVQHDLSALNPQAEKMRVQLPGNPRELHRLMRALRSEQGSSQLKFTPVVRQAAALALGMTATSTAQERIDAAIYELSRELSLPLTACSEDELKNQLTRASRRPLGPLALRVANTVHLINTSPEITAHAEGRPWVQVHVIRPRPTPLSRLLEAVDRWTEGDFLADPSLEHLIGRLDPQRKERPAFLHARAGLVLTEALKPKVPSFVQDWQAALAELLSGAPPAATLRVHVTGRTAVPSDYGFFKLPTFVWTEAQLERARKNQPLELHQLPPLGDLVLTRHDTLIGFQGTRASYKSELPFDPTSILPTRPEAARDPESWIDAFEGSLLSSFGARHEHCRKLKDWTLHALLKWHTQSLKLPTELWREADLELALAWLALRRALSAPQSIQLPDGSILLSMGGPFFAELRITPLADPSPHASVLASLLLELPAETVRSNHEQSALAVDFRQLVATHTVKGGYDFGARLPTQLSLVGARFYATIRFRGSALFADSSALPAVASVIRREEELAEEERRRRDDDDD